MKQRDSKPKSAKQTSKKRTPKTQPLSTRATAVRLFKLLHDPGQDQRTRYELTELVDELINNANPATPDNNQKEFERAFMASARVVESIKKPRNTTKTIELRFAHDSYAAIQKTLARLDAGETLSDIFKPQKKDAAKQPIDPIADFTERIIATITNERTPEQLKDAICAILVDDLSNYSNTTWYDSPEVLRVYLPYMLRGVGEQYADGIMKTIHTITDALAGDDVSEEISQEVVARRKDHPAQTSGLTHAAINLPSEQRDAPLDYNKEAERIINALEHPETPDEFKGFLHEFLSSMAIKSGLMETIIDPGDFRFTSAAIRALYPIMRFRDGASVGVKLLLSSAAYLLPGDTPEHLAGLLLREPEQKGQDQ
jgi:hypothetical protein